MTRPFRRGRSSVLRTGAHVATIVGVEASPLIDRQELVATLFAIADVNANVERILQPLEEELGGEEGLPEENT